MGEGGRRIADGFSHPHPWLCCAPSQASRAIQREAPEPARKADLSHKRRSTPHLPCRTWQRQWPGCRVPPSPGWEQAERGVRGGRPSTPRSYQNPLAWLQFSHPVLGLPSCSSVTLLTFSVTVLCPRHLAQVQHIVHTQRMLLACMAQVTDAYGWR